VGSVIVEAVLDGYNGTVFAYGQTGCGKSFTMRGFIERALEHLFEATSTASSETRYYILQFSLSLNQFLPTKKKYIYIYIFIYLFIYLFMYLLLSIFILIILVYFL